jgi:hypothetical protein
MKRLLPLALLVLTGCASVESQTHNPKVGQDDHPGSIPILLGLEPVRQDLKLSSLQCALLDSLRTEYKSRCRKITALGMTDVDAGIRASWDLKSVRNQFNSRALAVLSSSQQDRLRQIERQMLGGNLLTSPAEQKLLGLTPDQQRRIASIAAGRSERIAAINAKYQNPSGSSFLKDLNLRRYQRSTSSQMLSVLTDHQSKQWLVLCGQKTGLPKVHDPNASMRSLDEGY